MAPSRERAMLDLWPARLAMADASARADAGVSAIMVDEVSERTLVCPVNATLDVISGKWKPSIPCELRAGPRRFGELKREIPAISEKVLSADLRALEADGIVSRRQFYEGAVLATEYSFTGFGRTLIPALNALAQWGLEHARPPR